MLCHGWLPGVRGGDSLQCAEIGAEFGGVGVAFVEVAGHCFGDDLIESRADGGLDLAGGSGCGAEDRFAHVGERLAAIGAHAGDHLVEADAEGVDVGAPVEVAAKELFGRDVVEAADDGADAGDALEAGDASEAEVEDFDAIPAIDEKVFGLDVAMDKLTLFVGVGEGVGGLGGDFERLPDG